MSTDYRSFILFQATRRMNQMIDESSISDWKALTSVYTSAFFCSLGFFVVSFLIPIIAYGYMDASAIEVALVFSLLTLGSAMFSPITKTTQSEKLSVKALDIHRCDSSSHCIYWNGNICLSRK